MISVEGARLHELTCRFLTKAQAERLRTASLFTKEPVLFIISRAVERELALLENAVMPSGSDSPLYIAPEVPDASEA